MPISFVLVDRDGHSEFVNYVTPFSERANPLSARSIEDADVALVDCRWPTGVIQALEAAHNHGIPGVVDVDRPINPDPDGSLMWRPTGRAVPPSPTALRQSGSASSSTTADCAERYGHLTAQQAGRLARVAGPRRLVLSRFCTGIWIQRSSSQMRERSPTVCWWREISIELPYLTAADQCLVGPEPNEV